MAISRSTQQVTWASANSVSVAIGGATNSDIVTLAAATFAAAVTLKADNAGAPASGDTVDFYILRSTGDPDADPDTADEYDSNDTLHPVFLKRLDTNTTDPAVATIELPIAAQKVKIRAVNNAASSVTVSAQIETVEG